MLAYVSPTQMNAFRKVLESFAGPSLELRCVRAHFFSDESGSCDLLQTKGHEEIYVLANRSGKTFKVCKKGLQIAVNVLTTIHDLEECTASLKEQRRSEKKRQEEEILKKEQLRSKPAVVLFKKPVLGGASKK